MTHIQESPRIKDVLLVALKPFADDRGRFIETFRKAWFPQRSWDIIQTNRSDSKAGVLRGLHYHHHQVDYWYVPRGVIRVGLCDLRPSSPTYLAHHMIEIGDDNQTGIFIPTGVAHGFVALTDATLTYLVDNYYDGSDEHGVAWNDPTLNLPWGVKEPVLSPRDLENPFLADIPPGSLPR
ncbi:MAG: dTDP-4-dehydrorhamnose 3,5-epimerase family protein [Anaerolineae bacterium]